MYSTAYIEHLKNGPFPGRIDPWAEDARYFQQIHSGIIDHILRQIQDPLMRIGYLAGKETSLQIIESRQPDLFVRRDIGDSPTQEDIAAQWDYTAAAEALMVEPGLEAEKPEIQAIHLKDMQTGELVTVVEIISPGNKTRPHLISEYRDRRERLLYEKGVNVVEIDATRSVQRLLDHDLAHWYAYHTAVYLPRRWARVIGSHFDQPLKSFALPLRAQVIPVGPQSAYEDAYRLAAVANHVLLEERYSEQGLPFPSLLTDEQRQEALQMVMQWQSELMRLKPL